MNIDTAYLFFPTINLLFVSYLVYTQIKALQPPSILFQFKMIIIKSANKQGLIQSHSRVDESYTYLCQVKLFQSKWAITHCTIPNFVRFSR